MDPEHPIGFQGYAVGPNSALDVLSSIRANPEMNLERLATLCRGSRLDQALLRVLHRDV